MCHLPETGPEDRNVASSIHQSKQTWCHGPPQWESACFLPRRPHCRSVPEQGGLCPAVRAPGLGKVQLPASSVTKLQQPSESLQVTSQPLLGLSPQEDEPASCRPAPLGVLRTAEAAGLAGHPSPFLHIYTFSAFTHSTAPLVPSAGRTFLYSTHSSSSTMTVLRCQLHCYVKIFFRQVSQTSVSQPESIIN